MINLEKCKLLKKAFEKSINIGNLDEAQSILNEYSKLNKSGLEYYSMKAILCFIRGEYKEGENILLDIYDKYEYNFDINYNLSLFALQEKKYKKSLEYLFKAMLIDSSKSKECEIQLSILKKKIRKSEFDKIKNSAISFFNNFNKSFPFMDIDKDYVGSVDLKFNDKSYGVGIYDHYFEERDGLNVPLTLNQSTFTKTEIIPGEKVKEQIFKVKNKSLMPIMVLKGDSELVININKKEDLVLKSLLPNRFYYYPLESGDEVIIVCKDDFVLGDLIDLNTNDNNSKLILNIFVDGLSQKFLKENGFEDVMPNTYKFFKEGTICENCYVSGEWTYVSLASFFTGMYTTNHRVFHSKWDTDNIKNKELYTEIFNENGYFCSKIDGDWRSTPAYGYVKGMNRYLYQPSVRGMHCDEIITETIEHLEAFKEKNNFLWICIPDLHDIADEFEGRISTQVKDLILWRIDEKTEETSVRKNFNINKINRYRTQIKRIDTYLGLLFNYIRDNYKDDEIIINMISDHGQGYLVKSDEFLDEERTNTVMMFRGKNIPKGICKEFVQGLDLFPIVFNSLGIKNYNIKDGNIPKWFGGEKEREYTYTETIFPGSPYAAVINDENHKFFFETIENCTEDGRINVENYKIKLINKNNNLDESEILKEKVNKYISLVMEHIKDYIII
ncbi:sulfatase-like hydrolase/transferase [Clostridium fallax]|uniref:Arylsulfatase A n=1 Tax=Clostridium fallax TaxID=1533 RepID=A0A1M4UKJ2_9CLOT|nr:sulfatase-like hydrolase/transferase [Clostridium fallax]SHE57219.1 Arylsulfatase A [Clostridium fallax]SQB07616.1 sulfatase [Clostridium fallax]